MDSQVLILKEITMQIAYFDFIDSFIQLSFMKITMLLFFLFYQRLVQTF